MSPQERLLHVFCLVDDELQALNVGRLRPRGPCPKLADSEVITKELVGEFSKLHTDQDLFRHFRRYHLTEFPALAQVDRTTFARQAANLWHLKQLIQQRLPHRLVGDTRCGWSIVYPSTPASSPAPPSASVLPAKPTTAIVTCVSGPSTASVCICVSIAMASLWAINWQRREPARRRC